MHASDVVAAIELAFYIPTAILTVAVCSRHGFYRSSGWIYTLILCIVRIAGAICQFRSRHDHSENMTEAKITIDSVGLSPLLLATLGLLSRFVDFINAKTISTFTIRHFRLLQLLITLGLILSIVGGTSGTIEPGGAVQVAATSKVGIVLYIVAFVVMLFVYSVSIRSTSVIAKQERRIPAAIVFALPLILVRLIYAACAVFLHNHLFNIITGSMAVQVSMAIIEEFLVSAIYVAVGFLVTSVDPSAQGPIAGREWKMKGSKGVRRTRRT
ncbi:hypothetical protein HBH56_000110 [Parastagonospora nodorum]|uniref:DUF7702 domain-containing protein n=1 Tax=Phaeosphaeria nodorum (strain SN15 / ATCC MYA-4574 / FGSC 10173) TaxID=321614 RepID=A0A7U2EP70_PHANO|nr:hypothetical protein HBH56_000110 [Parastagonospora nodorum]QRC90022.1 hypothetical protein JI435_094490 [Parastagonospora nodorum SN15]KAH3938250.1 hypothetical protein HBH54_000120 [Parastagonospora nodorum]KAH4035875.1 hypothetical protein HBI09_093050 [Parastagonospora nodorum]KAH4145895.1 hypothetical protein HBH45_012410 [Parastagonospora nodorum]